MIKSKKKSSVIIMLAALLIALPLSGDAQSITRNKKKQTTTTKTTTKSKQGNSSYSDVKTNKNSSQKSSNRTSSATRKTSYNHKVETITVNGATFDMIWVEGGTFTMGWTAEQGRDEYGIGVPTHQVTLSGYYIGKNEVTQELWQAVMGRNPSYRTGNSRCPVEQVSWNDCQEFIAKLNKLTGKRFRLPTEAEWEYAARGGKKSRRNKYSGSNTLDNVAWYEDNSGSITHPVGQKSPNELGLYDMSGNVWEWCKDWYGGYNRSTLTNPSGPSSGSSRVNRGGSWNLGSKFCRISFRGGTRPDEASPCIGLRLAM